MSEETTAVSISQTEVPVTIENVGENNNNNHHTDDINDGKPETQPGEEELQQVELEEAQPQQQQQQQPLDDLYEEYDSNRKSGILTIWGNKQTMNLNHMVHENIVQSPYYRNKLADLNSCHELVDEIYYNVSHLEPWERGTRKTTGQTGMCGGVRGVGAGGVVSTPFCIMYKLFQVKLTRKQLYSLLNHTDSPYIRGIGFMYIRFCLEPSTFWDWYERYLEDEEEIDPKAGGGDAMTMGQFIKLLLTKLDWYCTLFPRIPVPVQKEIEQKMREHNKKLFDAQRAEGEDENEEASKNRDDRRPGSKRNSSERERVKRSHSSTRHRSASRKTGEGGRDDRSSSRSRRHHKKSKKHHSRHHHGHGSSSRHDEPGDRNHASKAKKRHRSRSRSTSRSKSQRSKKREAS